MAINSFIRHIQSEKRYSEHTISAYQQDLTQFETFLNTQYELTKLEKATVQMIKSFVIELKTNNFSNRSINRKLSSLRSFYLYLLKENVIETSPVATLKSLKKSKDLPAFVPESDIEKLEFIEFGTHFEGLRDRLIFEILYQTGIRRTELTNLKDQNIDFSNSTIKVLGKRNKERIIPFLPALGNLIKEYQKVRDEKFQSIHIHYLIVNSKGNYGGSGLIYQRVNAILQKITSLKKTSPHVLRHTFATHLLNKGADLLAIKELLGHTSLEATQVYTHNTIEQLKKIHQQAHPKGN